MASTLLLDRDSWDLCLTTTGDIALATEPYSQAQDIASECRLFEGELWYDTSRGLPYFTGILGQYQPIQLLKASLTAAAELVPGVQVAQVYLADIANRALSGQVQFRTPTGIAGATL